MHVNKKNSHKEKFKPITFPKDEQKHNHIIEWWYFNGNLKTKKGKEVSYMNCLFSVKPDKINIPIIKNIPLFNIYFTHYLIHTQTKFKHKTSPLCLMDKNSFLKPYLWIHYDNSCLIEKRNQNTYHIVNNYIDLELTPNKKPLLINKNGFIDLKTKTSYYYSLTRMQSKGWIKINKSWEEVEGSSWMDHQWAQTPLTEEDQWIWFSIQLDNNIDILCFEYGNQHKTTHTCIIDENEKCFYPKTIFIKPQNNKYKSIITKKEYQLEYVIEIPKMDITIHVSPKRKAQEMVFGSINYWEGSINVKAIIKGKNVTGRGFMELLPSARSNKIINAIAQEIKKNSIQSNIKEITNLSTKSIYLLGEEFNNKNE